MPANTVRVRGTFDDKISPALGKIDNRFTGLTKGQGFKALAMGVGLGAGQAAFNLLGGAAHAAGDFIGDSIAAASDLNETLSKSSVVFGTAAGEIERFGDSAANSLGLSKQAAIEAAATFGNFFTGVGETQGRAAEMSKTMVQLAGDLASFNNLDPTVTLDKLRAGLAGEAEPLRAVGVFMNEAKVKAKAMELGLGDAHGELTEGQKILARYQIILDETGTAQGDFARTSDGLANSQRKANAQLEDARAALGEKLLPAQVKVTEAQIDFFTSLQAIGDAMADKTTPETLALGAAIFKAKDATYAADLAALKYRDSLIYMGNATKDDNIWAMRRALVAVGDSSEDTAEKFNKMVDDLKSDVHRLISDVYDPISERDSIAANDVERAALRRIIASKKSTDAEIADARRRLRSLESSNVDYLAGLVESGDATETEYKRLMTILEKKSKTSTGKAKEDVDDLIAKVKELYRVMVSGPAVKIGLFIRDYGAPNKPGKQHGGPVHAGEAYTVGEAGPETLVMGNQGGTIIPNGQGWGGGITVNFNSTFPPSPSQAQQTANAVIPGLIRELRRQRLVS